MPSPDEAVPLAGEALLDAVTDAIVALHVRYYHRVPLTAKTRMLGDDLLACTLGGIYTEIEKTLIEVQQGDVVRETRGTFQSTIRAKYVGAVERLAERKVRAFMSNLHVGPDLAVELFLLEPGRADRTRHSASE